jgi:hypothetical protein
VIAKRVALVFFLVVLLAAPAMAFGATATRHTVPPTRSERTAILKAFGFPKEAWHCQRAGLADSNHNYATVWTRSKSKCIRNWGFDGVNILKRRDGNHWKLVFSGSDYDCPVPRIPRQVQRDLGVCT